MSSNTIFFKSHILIQRFKLKVKANVLIGINKTTKVIDNGDPEKKVRIKSPLGFFYEKTIRSQVKAMITKSRDFYFFTGRTEYLLSYPVQYSETGMEVKSISQEERPWNIIPRDKSLKDNEISWLFQKLNLLFIELEEEKSEIITQETYLGNDNIVGIGIPAILPKDVINFQSVSEARSFVMKDLFGYSEGPLQQTNNQKILSHGFDLKSSFRKDKEVSK